MTTSRHAESKRAEFLRHALRGEPETAAEFLIKRATWRVLLGWLGIFGSLAILVVVLRLVWPRAGANSSPQLFGYTAVLVACPFVAMYIQAEWERACIRILSSGRLPRSATLRRATAYRIVASPGLVVGLLALVTLAIGLLTVFLFLS